MKVIRIMPEETESFTALHQQHLEIVLALTRANSDLLKVRQQASGIEFDVMACERNHAEEPQNAQNAAALDEIYVQEKAAKQKLMDAEIHIEGLERRLTDITQKMGQLET